MSLTAQVSKYINHVRWTFPKLVFCLRDISLVPNPVNGPLPVLAAADVQDGPQQPRGGLPVRRARQSADRAEEPHHAPPGQQPQVCHLSLSGINK